MPNDNILEKVIESANENVLENETHEKDLLSIQKREFINIFSSDAITEEDINEYFASDLVKLIVLAGLPENGKSTLISSIYDKFLQDGKFGDYEFAGSKTIIGFEKRSYLSRLKNGQITDTRRTSLLDDNPFLDISLMNRKCMTKQRVVFVDVSGEVFQKIQKDDTSIKSFNSLHRANHFSYILDISQYNEPSQRHLAKDIAKTIIRSVKDQEMFSPNINIEIVFTKWDQITDNDAIQNYKNSIINDIKEILPSLKVSSFYVNSISDELPFQLLDLFNHWMNTPCIHDYSNELETETINWAQDYYKYLDYNE